VFFYRIEHDYEEMDDRDREYMQSIKDSSTPLWASRQVTISSRDSRERLENTPREYFSF
jgi:hypothetical protein